VPKIQTARAQLQLELTEPTKKAKRGRPRGRTTVAHERRERFAKRFPLHVTMRVRKGLGTLRRSKALRVLHTAILAGGHRDAFRICHFNLLGNHLHLIAEADGAEALARGMQGFGVRLARGFNRVLSRSGKLFAERYHARPLKTPREVRNGLAYVLLNMRHHSAAPLGTYWIDPYSSGAWFDGWRDRVWSDEPAATAAATRWLLTTGWRRWGPIAFDDVPGATGQRRSGVVSQGTGCGQ
jgi:hypothetical protein